MSRRPSLREEQKVLTVNRVLDAAVTVFAEKSVVGAAMDDIAKAAGVTRATVYAHFGGGKSDIIQALVTRAYAALEDSYAQLAAVETWTEAVVRD
jgi:AcrR family transcriptional regulator